MTNTHKHYEVETAFLNEHSSLHVSTKLKIYTYTDERDKNGAPIVTNIEEIDMGTRLDDELMIRNLLHTIDVERIDTARQISG